MAVSETGLENTKTNTLFVVFLTSSAAVFILPNSLSKASMVAFLDESADAATDVTAAKYKYVYKQSNFASKCKKSLTWCGSAYHCSFSVRFRRLNRLSNLLGLIFHDSSGVLHLLVGDFLGIFLFAVEESRCLLAQALEGAWRNFIIG